MSTATATAPWVLAPSRARAARAEAAYHAWRFFTGALLLALMCGSVGLAYTVVHERVGFQPVLSPSMVPTFRPGDLIITKAEPATDVKVGQVVALPIPHEAGQRYVHRIISVTLRGGKPVVRTKGDANPAPEPFSLRIDSPTVPVVIATVPGFGRVTTLLRHGWLRLLILAITVGCGAVAAKRLIQGVRQPTETVEPAEIEDN